MFTVFDVYWQTGVVYCAAPAAAEYENLGIFVPGAYMSATERGATLEVALPA